MRYSDWPKRLSDYLESKKNTPFEWGVNDCIMFAAKGLEAITGQNHYQEYVGYTTEVGAKALLDANGGFEGIIGKHIGPGHRKHLMARRGDLALLKIPNFTCGIVDDSGQFVAVPSENGLVKYPLTKAWRIWAVD